MSSNDNTPATGFIGWFRPRKAEPWQALCEASSWSACWDLLANPKGGDKVVLQKGQHPDDRPKGDLEHRRGRGQQQLQRPLEEENHRG